MTQTPMPAFSFRFAEPDREKYGDGWYTFDDAKLGELRARDLMALEAEIKAEFGLPMLAAVDDFWAKGMVGSLVVMWLAVRLAGRDDPLGEFNPLVYVPESRIGGAPDEVPPAGASSSSPENEEA